MRKSPLYMTLFFSCIFYFLFFASLHIFSLQIVQLFGLQSRRFTTLIPLKFYVVLEIVVFFVALSLFFQPAFIPIHSSSLVTACYVEQHNRQHITGYLCFFVHFECIQFMLMGSLFLSFPFSFVVSCLDHAET